MLRLHNPNERHKVKNKYRVVAFLVSFFMTLMVIGQSTYTCLTKGEVLRMYSANVSEENKILTEGEWTQPPYSVNETEYYFGYPLEYATRSYSTDNFGAARVTFYDYFTNTIADSTYQYQIRMIKENVGYQRQFVEVYVISSPPSPGYSTAIISYPSGSVDSNGNTIDITKNSPYNITNGTNFLNPCGSTYSTNSPAGNSSFVFSSDSTGTSWVFNNNSHVSV